MKTVRFFKFGWRGWHVELKIIDAMFIEFIS